jgi:hypothetical protein
MWRVGGSAGQRCRSVAWGLGLLMVERDLRRGWRSRGGCGTLLAGADDCSHSIAIAAESVSDIEEGDKVECCLGAALMVDSRTGQLMAAESA